MLIYRALLAALVAGAAQPRDPIVMRDGANSIALVIREVAPPDATGRTTVIASTDQADRMDDIVDQATWKLDEYRANPVILWVHDSREFPIGKCVDVQVVEGKLRMVIEWDESTEDGATCARQFREGFLSAVSVGFRPGRTIMRSQLPKEDPRYKEAGWGCVFYDCTLLECSAVPVPANPGALVTQRSAREVEGDQTIARALDLEAELEILRRGHAELLTLVRGLPAMVAAEIAKLREAAQTAQTDSVAAIRQHLDETAERAIVDTVDEWADWSEPEPAAPAAKRADGWDW